MMTVRRAGEHVPSKYEGMLLRNLHAHARSHVSNLRVWQIEVV